MSEELKKIMARDIELVNKALCEYLSETDADFEVLFKAVNYSVDADGKRIRPFLTLEFCRLFAGNINDALPYACAVEMIHTYSLIHDDLPCMDNDSMRRGKPTNHKVFGESTALLAGDALLTRAFGVAASAHLPARNVVRAMEILSEKAGMFGMIGGQQIDLLAEGGHGCDERILRKMHEKKTGALIEAACRLGANASRTLSHSAEDLAAEYARALGMAFQIRDDILDACGDPDKLGKDVGSDSANGKTTFVTLYGMEESMRLAAEYTERAIDVVKKQDGTGVLVDFAREMLVRDR